ncbi:hypothetical protein D9613_008810 [Agrocybe pediades]|uniref:Uncharacterized protein n=1 Tax=Agrocybe pediades TaxID=84607 RepID=A0A8H4QSN2_9AGAR|nr:hypothetical protein D9613_008810 [Agrocybe pediades]
MVQDTGATPTMIPNPDFQRRREKKIKEVSELKLDAVDTEVFDWDDSFLVIVVFALDCHYTVQERGKPKSNAASSPSSAPLLSIVATPQMSSWGRSGTEICLLREVRKKDLFSFQTCSRSLSLSSGSVCLKQQNQRVVVNINRSRLAFSAISLLKIVDLLGEQEVQRKGAHNAR